MARIKTKISAKRSNAGDCARQAWRRMLGVVILALGMIGMIGMIDARSAAADEAVFALWAQAPIIAHGHAAACAKTDRVKSPACGAAHGAQSCLVEPNSVIPPPLYMAAEDSRARLVWHSLSLAPDPPPPRTSHA